MLGRATLLRSRYNPKIFGLSGSAGASPSQILKQRIRAGGIMRHQVGFLLQLAVLSLLPMLILWQLAYGFELIWMPALTVAGIVLFWIGYRLRES